MDKKIQETLNKMLNEKIKECCKKYAEVSNALEENPKNQELLKKEAHFQNAITLCTMALNDWYIDKNTNKWVFSGSATAESLTNKKE